MKKITKAKKYLAGATLMLSLMLASCQTKTPVETTKIASTQEDLNTLESESINLIETEVSEEYQESENLSYQVDEGYLSISNSLLNENYNHFTEEAYQEINEKIEDNSVNFLFLGHLGNTFDLSKLNLKNINTLRISCPLSNFNYQPLENLNVAILEITVDENTNTESMLNYLKNMKKNGITLRISFENGISAETQNEYMRVLSELKGINGIRIVTDKLNDLDLSNIKTSYLSLVNETTEREIGYALNINENVDTLTLMTNYPHEYEGTPEIKKITVNTPNNNLYVELLVTKIPYDDFRGKITKDSIINIKTDNLLQITGIDFQSMQKEDFETLKNFKYILMNNSEDKETFVYDSYKMTFDEAIDQINEKSSVKKR